MSSPFPASRAYRPPSYAAISSLAVGALIVALLAGAISVLWLLFGGMSNGLWVLWVGAEVLAMLMALLSLYYIATAPARSPGGRSD